MQLLIFNEEFLVRAVHQTALITSLPLVHTARRYYRLDGLVSHSDCGSSSGNRALLREVTQTLSSRGSKSRNKVSVGEPAEGSLSNSFSSESSLKKPRALLPRVFGLSALDFDVRWVRSGRQVCLNSPWTASWRVLLKLKALRPFQEVNCCSPVRSSATVD